MKCVSNYVVSVRPGFHCQNHETHGETVILDRYALVNGFLRLFQMV